MSKEVKALPLVQQETMHKNHTATIQQVQKDNQKATKIIEGMFTTTSSPKS